MLYHYYKRLRDDVEGVNKDTQCELRKETDIQSKKIQKKIIQLW